MTKKLGLALAAWLVWTNALYAQLGYYRDPAIHGDTIVFAAEGDLWRVGVDGGAAQRLTTHPENEQSPAISPDGETVAFSATYEGPLEVYTMPLDGGLPVRQTWEADDSVAVGFTPDGRLLYTTTYYATLPDPQVVALEPETGERTRVPLAQVSDGVYDDDGSAFYFVRPEFHANRTKRYQGGTARNIWKFVQGEPEAEILTPDFPGESHSPMWWRGRVYFVCDRDGTMNIWSMDADGGDLRQHTRHDGWDVFSPSLSGGRIVYQLGADLWLFDIATGEDRVVPIRLTSDFDQLRERWVEDPMEYLTSAHIDAEGARVVLTSRGRVFVAPVKSGRLVRASGPDGVRYRDAAFLPDGSDVVALSDETGELELVLLPANGVGSAERLTDNGTILRLAPLPSPDGERIAFRDRNNDLYVVDRDSGEQVRVSTNREGIVDYSWSPDGRWLAFTEYETNTFMRIFLYDTEAGVRVPLTSDRVNSHDPAWDPGGEFLYFLSDRDLRSLVSDPWGPRQPEPYFDRATRIYVVALEEGDVSPFKPDTELTVEPEPPAEDESDVEEAPVAVSIGLDGIGTRIREVPVDAGNYSGLSVGKDAVFWLEKGSELDAPVRLRGVPIGNEGEDPETLVEDVTGYEMSGDHEHLLVRKEDGFYVIDAAASEMDLADLEDAKVDLSGWSFPIDVREDFRQLFVDAWRLERDYFYDPGMHGVDWDAMLGKYLPLADRVTNRSELNDLIGQLVSELSALHVGVYRGDLRSDSTDVVVASLGARLVRDEAAGGDRIDYIYQSDPDYPDRLSPLADPDLGIEPGDVILAINGTDVLGAPDPNALLRNQEDRQVLLTLRSGASGEMFDRIVVPTDDERDLRYRDWEYTRRVRVEEAGEGDIGYVHLRAMGTDDLSEWYRSFYPVFNRSGLIIDVRHNNGGNIDSILLEKLLREAWFFWQPRVGEPFWNMQYAFRGHVVVLADEMTASDGEAFTEGIRRLDLGTIIGTRTWGGEIWLDYDNLLTDGGLASAPQLGVYTADGQWLIEGHGVDPDIPVDNMPHQTFEGEDAQLDAAIEFLKQKIAGEPVTVPPAPPYPDKSF
jgi:tricorn protease